MSHELFAHAGFAAEDEAAADASAQAQYEYEARQQEEQGGDGNARDLGVVAEGNEDGQQVLGTCSPELVVAYCQLQARLHHIRNARVTAPEKDAVEQCITAARELLGGGL